MAPASARGQAGACGIAHSSRLAVSSRVVCRARKAQVGGRQRGPAVLLLCTKPLFVAAPAAWATPAACLTRAISFELQKQQEQQQSTPHEAAPAPAAAPSSSAPEVPVQPVTREFNALGSKVVESNVAFKGPEDEPDFWEGNQFEVSTPTRCVNAGIMCCVWRARLGTPRDLTTMRSCMAQPASQLHSVSGLGLALCHSSLWHTLSTLLAAGKHTSGQVAASLYMRWVCPAS